MIFSNFLGLIDSTEMSVQILSEELNKQNNGQSGSTLDSYVICRHESTKFCWFYYPKYSRKLQKAPVWLENKQK